MDNIEAFVSTLLDLHSGVEAAKARAASFTAEVPGAAQQLTAAATFLAGAISTARQSCPDAFPKDEAPE